MKQEISNNDDVLDSRDVIERIAELEGELDEQWGEYQETHGASTKEAWLEKEAYDDSELTALQALAEEGQNCADWRHGETLVRDSYFKEYAQQLAEDLGMDRESRWPYCHIDWDAAAHSLKMDYSSIEFDGVTYWVRS